MSDKVLVTGGAGFIGSHLAEALVREGHQVRVLDALVPQVHGENGPVHLPPEVEFVAGDVRDAASIEAALEGIDVVFHEAAEVGVGQSMYEMTRYVASNTLGTATMLEALVKRRDRVRKLVVASSMSIYGEGAYRDREGRVFFPPMRSLAQLLERRWEVEGANGEIATPVPTSEEKPLHPTSVYSITKQDQEQLSLIVGRAYDIPTVALRYFNVYGPRQALSNPYTGVCAIFSARLLNDQRPQIFEDGNQTRDFVHVSDIVRANLLALSSERANYQCINIGGGSSITVRRIAEMLAEGLGKDIEPEIVGRYREGDVRHCIADITRAQALLGYEPSVRFEDGIRGLLDWVRDQRATDGVERATAELAARRLVR